MTISSLWLGTPAGTHLREVSGQFLKLQYIRTVNDVGALALTLPGDFNTNSLILPDGRIEVWRRLPGGREVLDTDTVWFVQGLDYVQDADGERTIEVSARSAMFLLDEPGRFVDYAAGTSGAAKTAAADDLIKAVVRENLGSSAATARNLSAYLSVQTDSGSASSITKAFSWQPVLKVLQEVAAASTEKGIYLAFDIVAPTPDRLEFQTFTQQRGSDHRFPTGVNPVMIGPDFGNMGAARLSYDYSAETTYAKAGGTGEGSGRLTGEYLDSTRAEASPFRRREAFIDANNTATTAALTDAATGAVREGRPRVILNGTILSTPDTQYGVHWVWGDYVTVQMFGVQVDARVDAVTITVTPNSERVEAVIRGETYL